jgi:hypothetical protein
LKKTDYLFWSVLLAIALFYIFKGNDIYKEKYQITKQKSEIKQEN